MKLFVEYLFTEGYITWEVPQAVSLALIVVIFTGAYFYARRQVRLSADRSRWAEKLRGR